MSRVVSYECEACGPITNYVVGDVGQRQCPTCRRVIIATDGGAEIAERESSDGHPFECGSERIGYNGPSSDSSPFYRCGPCALEGLDVRLPIRPVTPSVAERVNHATKVHGEDYREAWNLVAGEAGEVGGDD